MWRPLTCTVLVAAAMLWGCDSPRGHAREASLDVCALLDSARVASLVGKPLRLVSEPHVAGSDMAGSCRVVDDKESGLLAVGVWTDGSLGAAGMAAHVSSVFERRVELELAERKVDGNPVERRDLEPESGKAILLVPASDARSPAGMFLGVDRGALVSIVHAGITPDGLGEFGMGLMKRLREGPSSDP